MIKPVFERKHPFGGVQKIFRFGKCGASVVKIQNVWIRNTNWEILRVVFLGSDPLDFEPNGDKEIENLKWEEVLIELGRIRGDKIEI